MLAVVNGAVLGRLAEIPAYLNHIHAQNQKDVLAIDNLSPHPRPFQQGKEYLTAPFFHLKNIRF